MKRKHTTYEWQNTDPLFKKIFFFFFKPHSHSNGVYWGHQCSWTFTPANSIQVSIMKSDDYLKSLGFFLFSSFLPAAAGFEPTTLQSSEVRRTTGPLFTSSLDVVKLGFGWFWSPLHFWKSMFDWSTSKRVLLLKKWANPGLFFFYFWCFQTNNTIFSIN